MNKIIARHICSVVCARERYSPTTGLADERAIVELAREIERLEAEHEALLAAHERIGAEIAVLRGRVQP